MKNIWQKFNKLLSGCLLLVLISLLGACNGAQSNPQKKEGVLLYFKNNFDQGKIGFNPSKKASLLLTQDAISGKALEIVCRQKWAGAALKVHISGSKALKIAFMAKGINFKRATLNFFDQKAYDNTTPYGYRFLPEKEWTPVLYYVDLFHYNAKNSGYIREKTVFTELRFWGPDPQGKKVILQLDNFIIYRGEDTAPPQKVEGLRAATTREGIILSWHPAQDNVFPMVYIISRAEGAGDYIKIAESYRPKYKDKDVKPGITYHYRVLACDFQNNLGPWSEVISITHRFPAPAQRENRESIYESDRKSYANHLRKVHAFGKGRVDKGLVVLFGDSLTGPTLYPRLVAGALGIYRVKAYGFCRANHGFWKAQSRRNSGQRKARVSLNNVWH